MSPGTEGDTTMKKLFTKIIAMSLLLVTLICSVMPAQAANVCSYVSGDMNGTVTFSVTTDGSWLTRNSVTLTQTKGSAECHNIWYQIEKKSLYGHYTVTVKNSSGKTVQTKDWTGKTLSLSGLTKNSTYTITVKPASMTKGNILSEMLSSFYKWKSTPTWKVTKTSGLTLCY